MKKLSTILLISFLAVFLAAGAATASTITGVNIDRPFDIGPEVGIAPNYNVQEMLDLLFGTGMNAATDQSTVGVWSSVSAPPNAVVVPVLSFEFAGSQSANDLQSAGLWSGYDTTGPITTVEVFTGPASPNAKAFIDWTDSDTISISSSYTGINVGSFDGIPWDWFGFYYQFDDGTMLYTYDDLNPNSAVASLAYMAPSGAAWAIFFDGDLGTEGATGYDFNDLVLKVESIVPAAVPEPATMLLLGSGLIGLAGIGRKKFFK